MRKKISAEAAVKEWARGFVEKCAETGADPVEMFKRAQAAEPKPVTGVLPEDDVAIRNKSKSGLLTPDAAQTYQQAGRNIQSENWGAGDVLGETLKTTNLLGTPFNARDLWHGAKWLGNAPGRLFNYATGGGFDTGANNGPGAGQHIADNYMGPGRNTTERLRFAGGQPRNSNNGIGGSLTWNPAWGLDNYPGLNGQQKQPAWNAKL